ncbi:hypothetical protein L1987_84615 [Smallanthus sonchifolius]|uniref:Uncharacterized protein n=1 Tax=Smallanthus sonchifolius TaxID=185202 RepID=A0ACB8XUW9_9ASTR|nr:hypothetical protein L1987_84615 [Smallanthus sonchifolius]
MEYLFSPAAISWEACGPVSFSNRLSMSSDLNSKFTQVYDSLKSNLLHDPSFEFDDYSRHWVERLQACILVLDDVIDDSHTRRGQPCWFRQAQDDYLDTYGDPKVTGKIGLDIENFKCSWLVAKALELVNEEQKKILNENYGTKDPAKISKVKELYHTLNLKVSYCCFFHVYLYDGRS